MNAFAKTLGITLLTAATAIAPMTTTAYAEGDSGALHRQPSHAHKFIPGGKHTQWKYRAHRPQQGSQGYRHHRVPRHVYRGYRNHNDAAAAAIIGLGVGAIIGGAIANSHNNSRVIHRPAPAPRPYREHRVNSGGGGFEPWTKSWYRYCSNKYRSFNPSTGTFRGYDGRDHFCVVR
ncbi:MAG: BA14K family protein [Hoeflea sp.]|uniref:BA14K family protein n=1 Tax=Hoeflea sp. TaxID=1940281 RepID=UPI0032EE1609